MIRLLRRLYYNNASATSEKMAKFIGELSMVVAIELGQGLSLAIPSRPRMIPLSFQSPCSTMGLF